MPGEPLPLEQVASFKAALAYGEGFRTTESLAATVLDLAWHSAAPTRRSTRRTWRASRWGCWQRTASACRACPTENGGLLRANGDRFRAELLSRGGSVDPMAMFVAVRGREPRPEPLLRRRGLLPA